MKGHQLNGERYSVLSKSVLLADIDFLSPPELEMFFYLILALRSGFLGQIAFLTVVLLLGRIARPLAVVTLLTPCLQQQW